MPLKKGRGTIRANVTELVNNPIQSPARKKAIITLARRRNIPRADAKFVQARAIAVSQSRKK